MQPLSDHSISTTTHATDAKISQACGKIKSVVDQKIVNSGENIKRWVEVEATTLKNVKHIQSHMKGRWASLRVKIAYIFYCCVSRFFSYVPKYKVPSLEQSQHMEGQKRPDLDKKQDNLLNASSADAKEAKPAQDEFEQINLGNKQAQDNLLNAISSDATKAKSAHDEFQQIRKKRTGPAADLVKAKAELEEIQKIRKSLNSDVKELFTQKAVVLDLQLKYGIISKKAEEWKITFEGERTTRSLHNIELQQKDAKTKFDDAEKLYKQELNAFKEKHSKADHPLNEIISESVTAELEKTENIAKVFLKLLTVFPSRSMGMDPSNLRPGQQKLLAKEFIGELKESIKKKTLPKRVVEALGSVNDLTLTEYSRTIEILKSEFDAFISKAVQATRAENIPVSIGMEFIPYGHSKQPKADSLLTKVLEENIQSTEEEISRLNITLEPIKKEEVEIQQRQEELKSESDSHIRQYTELRVEDPASASLSDDELGEEIVEVVKEKGKPLALALAEEEQLKDMIVKQIQQSRSHSPRRGGR